MLFVFLFMSKRGSAQHAISSHSFSQLFVSAFGESKLIEVVGGAVSENIRLSFCFNIASKPCLKRLEFIFFGLR